MNQPCRITMEIPGQRRPGLLCRIRCAHWQGGRQEQYHRRLGQVVAQARLVQTAESPRRGDHAHERASEDQVTAVNSYEYPRESARRPRRAGAPAQDCAAGVPSARRSPATAIGATAIVLALSLVLSWRGECWAYIDPNAGGFLTQILAPLASIFLSFLFYCRKEIRKFIKSVRDRKKKIDSRDAAPESGK